MKPRQSFVFDVQPELNASASRAGFCGSGAPTNVIAIAVMTLHRAKAIIIATTVLWNTSNNYIGIKFHRVSI